jgi:hypothetical protein
MLKIFYNLLLLMQKIIGSDIDNLAVSSATVGNSIVIKDLELEQGAEELRSLSRLIACI